MGKVWVLDTETKGTGANVVPLDKVLKQPSAGTPLYVPPRFEPPPPAPPEPPAPNKFKVVDLMTRQTLIEGAGTRATVEALGPVRSVVDVSIYVWRPGTGRWRLLTFAERKALWELRRA